MNTVISIVSALVIFCVIILIHELGHFTVAKLCGIRVSEFSIGMGPALFKKQGKETLYSIRLLPIGGFCSMGEDVDSDEPDAFRKKPVFSRMLVILAGAFMNIVLGFILAVVTLVISGKGITTQIVYFADDAVSTSYGLQLNDTILKINGMSIFTANDITYKLSNDEDGIVDMVVRRDGQKVKLDDIHFRMDMNEETGKQTLTYDFKVMSEKITLLNVIPYAVKNTAYYARIVILSLGDLISGRYGINDLQGPVGIVTTIGGIAEETGFDIGFLFELATLITINIGIFNLLPLPALDGGRFVFLVIEAVRRKALKADVEGIIHFVGLALLMLLMLVVTFNDIKNIFVK